jgi:hypothetical protein
MNEQLIYTIAGENYILIEIPFLPGKHALTSAFCDKHGMVYQGIKEVVKGGFWGSSVCIQKFLLPERNFIKYSQDKIEL